jgi:hypothetical protein
MGENSGGAILTVNGNVVAKILPKRRVGTTAAVAISDISLRRVRVIHLISDLFNFGLGGD